MIFFRFMRFILMVSLLVVGGGLLLVFGALARSGKPS